MLFIKDVYTLFEIIIEQFAYNFYYEDGLPEWGFFLSRSFLHPQILLLIMKMLFIRTLYADDSLKELSNRVKNKVSKTKIFF